MAKKLSKQAQAKLDQGYRLTLDTCSNCIHYESEIISENKQIGGQLYEWTEERTNNVH